MYMACLVFTHVGRTALVRALRRPVAALLALAALATLALRRRPDTVAAELLTRDGRFLRLPVQDVGLLFFDVERRLETFDRLEGRPARRGRATPAAEAAPEVSGRRPAIFAERVVLRAAEALAQRERSEVDASARAASVPNCRATRRRAY